jgi:hypothetical protein
MARAQSQAAPPNSANIPVVSEKFFVVKRITNLSEPPDFTSKAQV